MIIRDKSPSAITQLYAQRLLNAEHVDQKPTPARGARTERDDVEISQEALALQKMAASPESEDVRWDKVAELRKQIQQGTYEPPLQELVQRLLGQA